MKARQTKVKSNSELKSIIRRIGVLAKQVEKHLATSRGTRKPRLRTPVDAKRRILHTMRHGDGMASQTISEVTGLPLSQIRLVLTELRIAGRVKTNHRGVGALWFEIL